ncbi:hypothetical protein HMPREF1143_1399 [Peptoanaerobacter stomatis]|uniref:Uncharacterized protein n=1 Tax=Peptoanaerobacter stomatis TaxID=796937 RepID=J4WFX2_9FIRM|nr:hypothetical protein HMPREF1143_1399 [Peptoanaerobacter stomatis]
MFNFFHPLIKKHICYIINILLNKFIKFCIKKYLNKYRYFFVFLF